MKVVLLYLSVLGCVLGLGIDDFRDSSHEIDADDPSNANLVTSTSMACESYQPANCDPAKRPDCDYVEKCKHELGMTTACMAVWSNTTDQGLLIRNKACWTAQDASACPVGECVAFKDHHRTNYGGAVNYFCCCQGSMCNSEVKYAIPDNTQTLTPPTMDVEGEEELGEVDPVSSFLYVFLPILFLALIIFLVFFIYRRRRLSHLAHREDPYAVNGVTVLKVPQHSSPPSSPQRPIQLVEVVARGRFGLVYRGRFAEEIVAVKVFPPQDWESWGVEQEMYGVAGMRLHPNILRFIGAEIRGTGPQMEYWLITEFQERGCLADYLKKNTVTFNEALHISVGILRGLAFLHEEVVGGEEVRKPTIVHRDMKSRNVLLKPDLSACISDFGLAMRCEHGRTPEETHEKVGTRRYMAVEVLEGATEFSAFAFRQIDIYATALILWELFSRCKYGEEEPDSYKLPFEEEVGQHPSLTELQELVVKKKQRPIIPESLREQPHGLLVASTIEEMWDTEPEARITAGCGLERLQSLLPQDTDSGREFLPESYPLITDFAR